MWMSTMTYLNDIESQKDLSDTVDTLDALLSGEPIPVKLSVDFSTGQMLIFSGVLIASLVLGIALGTAVSRGI